MPGSGSAWSSTAVVDSLPVEKDVTYLPAGYLCLSSSKFATVPMSPGVISNLIMTVSGGSSLPTVKCFV